jgi:putative transposase
MDNDQRPKRKSIRLKKYDYSTPGYYFVTICTKDRKCLFGEIKDQGMKLNEAGRMIDTVWHELPINYINISIDTFIVMPNHVNGIIVIQSSINVGAGPCACPQDPDPKVTNGQPQGVSPTNLNLSLPDIVHRYKSLTTHKYIKGVKQNNWKPFDVKLWQRNYYEHPQ